MTDKHIPVEKLEVLLKDATYHPKLGYVVPAIAIREIVDACKENPFDYTSPPADNLIAEKQATIDRLTEQNASQQVFCANYEATQFELVQAAKEVIRISDRKHDAWDKLKALIAEIEAKK